jgi:hypothetical protein
MADPVGERHFATPEGGGADEQADSEQEPGDHLDHAGPPLGWGSAPGRRAEIPGFSGAVLEEDQGGNEIRST